MIERWRRVSHMMRGHTIIWNVRYGVLTVICDCGKDFTKGVKL